MMKYFHTIKSILNLFIIFICCSYVGDFHTIKSILNKAYEFLEEFTQQNFHTIKSILNKDVYKCILTMNYISILLSLF